MPETKSVADTTKNPLTEAVTRDRLLGQWYRDNGLTADDGTHKWFGGLVYDHERKLRVVGPRPAFGAPERRRLRGVLHELGFGELEEEPLQEYPPHQRAWPLTMAQFLQKQEPFLKWCVENGLADERWEMGKWGKAIHISGNGTAYVEDPTPAFGAPEALRLRGVLREFGLGELVEE